MQHGCLGCSYIHIVKKLVKIAAFDKLKEVQTTHTNINTINYEQFKLQPYLDSNIITFEERSLVFNVRANTLNGFKIVSLLCRGTISTASWAVTFKIHLSIV